VSSYFQDVLTTVLSAAPFVQPPVAVLPLDEV
jgi:hypothetical protein